MQTRQNSGNYEIGLQGMFCFQALRLSNHQTEKEFPVPA